MSTKGHEIGTHLAKVATIVHRRRRSHTDPSLKAMAEQAAATDRTKGSHHGHRIGADGQR